MASLDDLLTASKNIVTAINGVSVAIQRSLGSATSTTVDANTLVITGKGRLVSFTVVDGGSADGAIYNTSTVGGGTAANQLVTVSQTAGVYAAGHAFNAGLVISPGTSQRINVTYYLG